MSDVGQAEARHKLLAANLVSVDAQGEPTGFTASS